jgi:hypothetical protein
MRMTSDDRFFEKVKSPFLFWTLGLTSGFIFGAWAFLGVIIVLVHALLDFGVPDRPKWPPKEFDEQVRQVDEAWKRLYEKAVNNG